MATGHRRTNRVAAKTQRATDRRRTRERRRAASTWLGAGALTLGVGATLVSGSAVAYASPTDTGSASSTAGSSDTSGTEGSSTAERSSNSSTESGSAAKSKGTSSRGSASDSTGTDSSQHEPDTTTDRVDTTTGNADATSNHDTSEASTPAIPSGTADPESTGTGTADIATATSGSSSEPTTDTSEADKHVAVSGVSHASAINDSSGAAEADTSSPQDSVPTVQAQVHPASLTLSAPDSKTSVPSPTALLTAASTTPTAGTAAVADLVRPPSMTVNPFEPIFNFVRALFGVNPNVAPNPRNFIQVSLYAIFTRIQQFVNPAPKAGTPIVAAADPNSGVVTGAAGFQDDSSDGVFFTAPAISSGGGTVSIDTATGAFTYTPTATQRLTAIVGSTDTFTVTAHDGLLKSTVSVTVPVDAGTPVARIPTTTDPAPQPGTGIVTGAAVFTDPAGRTLTYAGPAGGTSAGGGAVTVDATTGEYTFTPTSAQRFQSTINTDIFTVTASNGVHATSQTVTVPIQNFSQANYETREYTVYNISSQPLQYSGVSANKDNNSMDAQPAVGSILQPGASQQFSLVYYFKGTSSANVDYLNTVDGSLRRVGLTLEDGLFDLYPSTTCLSLGCSANQRYTAYFVDPPGTTVTLPATDPVAQAQVLQSLCNGNANASCSFKATSPPIPTLGLKHPVGAAVRNPTDLAGVSTTITVSDAQSVANSISVSVRASAKVFELVSVELTGTYQTTVTNTHTFTQAVTVPTPPHTESQILAEQPVISVTGDFTIVMGNTIFTVQGVTFEYPDPDGQSVYTIVSTPITDPAQTPLQQNLGDTVAV